MVRGPLAQPVQFLKGIGPRKAQALEEIGIRTVLDLLYYLPRRYLDRSTLLTIARLREYARAPRGPRSRSRMRRPITASAGK